MDMVSGSVLRTHELCIGFEIESVGVHYIKVGKLWKKERYKSEGFPECGFGSPQPGNTWWGIGADGSLENDDNIEVRSPINPPLQDIISVIKFMKSIGCKTNKHCGLHVHVSHPTLDIGIRLKGTHTFWKNRGEYMNTKYDKVCSNRYVPVNIIDSKHLEVRLFNGSLNLRYILRCLNVVRNSVVFEPIIEYQIKENILKRITHQKDMNGINTRIRKLQKGGKLHKNQMKHTLWPIIQPEPARPARVRGYRYSSTGFIYT